MKPLSPTLKERKRYIVYEVKSEKKLSFNEAREAIDNALKTLIGTLGVAKAGVIHLKKYWSNEKMRGILRVNHNFIDEVKASFIFINKVESKKTNIRSIYTTGVINKAKKHILEVV